MGKRVSQMLANVDEGRGLDWHISNISTAVALTPTMSCIGFPVAPFNALSSLKSYKHHHMSLRTESS